MKKKSINSLILLVIITMGLISCGKKTITTKPERKDITEMVFATGILKADDEYNLTAQAEGYIIALYFEEGDVVQAGKLMAVIDNKQNVVNTEGSKKALAIAETNANSNAPLFKQIEINIEAAKQKVKQDEIQVERYQNLLVSNSIAKVEYENMVLALTNSQANLNALQEQYNNLKIQTNQQVVLQTHQVDASLVNQYYNKITAIVGGKIYKKKKQIGDYVRKGDIIALIGNPNKIYAYLSIDEGNIAKIKLKQAVILQFNTNKDINYEGVITEIYPSFDEQTQSFYCRAEFTKVPDFIISGTQLQGNIISGNKKNVLVIPRHFLNYGNKVRIKDKGATVVETGFISNDWVEILKGLDENTIIEADKTK